MRNVALVDRSRQRLDTIAQLSPSHEDAAHRRDRRWRKRTNAKPVELADPSAYVGNCLDRVSALSTEVAQTAGIVLGVLHLTVSCT